MKRLFLALPVFALLFTSCKKDDLQDSANRISNTPVATAVPTSFTQKVLLENFTGASYNKCPMNDFEINSLKNSLGNRFIPVSLHFNDPLSVSHSNEIISRMHNGITPNIPSAMINRRKLNNAIFYLNNDWNTMINTVLSSNTSSCGLAISSTYNGNIIEIEVNAGFASLPNANYNLSVYLTEDDISNSDMSYAQSNIFNTVNGNPFFNMGNPITSYEHDNTLRYVATMAGGDPINMQNIITKQEDTKTYTIDLPNYFNPLKMNVVAFIHTPGLSSNGIVLNSQMAKLGSIQNYD